MKLTRNLWIFIAINTVSTLIFILSLKYSWGIEVVEESKDSATYETSTPFLYAAVWLFSGLLLGKYDSVRKSRMNLEFLYHAATWAITFVGLIFAAIIMDEFREPVIFLIAIGISALTLGIHWTFSRRKVKGIDAKSAFK